MPLTSNKRENSETRSVSKKTTRKQIERPGFLLCENRVLALHLLSVRRTIRDGTRRAQAREQQKDKSKGRRMSDNATLPGRRVELSTNTSTADSAP